MRQPAELAMLALGMLFAALPAHSEIAFDSMPIGCSWTVKYSSGLITTETYLGVKAGKHKTRVFDTKDPDKLVRHSYYDKKGRLVRKDWANGKWEKFTPFSCFDSLGSCTYTYSNADGVKQKISSKTVESGKGYKVTAGPDGGTPYPDEYFELGQFGLMARNSASNYSARIVSYDNCNFGS